MDHGQSTKRSRNSRQECFPHSQKRTQMNRACKHQGRRLNKRPLLMFRRLVAALGGHAFFIPLLSADCFHAWMTPGHTQRWILRLGKKRTLASSSVISGQSQASPPTYLYNPPQASAIIRRCRQRSQLRCSKVQILPSVTSRPTTSKRSHH